MKWNFERMNELEVYLPDEAAHDGYTTLLGGPKYGDHGRFNPGDGIGVGYEDLKTIEAYNFLQSIVDGEQREPEPRRHDTDRLLQHQEPLVSAR